jgi:hypothetical protein
VEDGETRLALPTDCGITSRAVRLRARVISSDAGGCLPCFDADGRVTHMDVGAAGALLETPRPPKWHAARACLAGFHVDTGPAAAWRKGQVAAGLMLTWSLDATGGADTVIIRGIVRPVRSGRSTRHIRDCLRSKRDAEPSPQGETRGWIVPIGGAENRKTTATSSSGSSGCRGRNADIVVIPTASRLNETGPRYQQPRPRR